MTKKLDWARFFWIAIEKLKIYTLNSRLYAGEKPYSSALAAAESFYVVSESVNKYVNRYFFPRKKKPTRSNA